MAEVTITHDRVNGTEVHGSVKGDGVFDVLRQVHGHWRARYGKVYLLMTRDKPVKGHMIRPAVAALEAAGHTVTVEVDDTARSTEDVALAEKERAERAENRADRFAGYGQNATAAGTALYNSARQMGEAIPLGQPMMPGHHSYARDVSYRKRMHSKYDRGFAELDRGEEWQRRAGAAEANQGHRESVPATRRRIDKLNADLRRVERAMAPRVDYHWDPEGGCPDSHQVIYQVCGRVRARYQAEADDLAAQIAYWEEQVAAAKAAGAVAFDRGDIAKGDYVRGTHGYWYEVLRVSAKSVTVPDCMPLIGITTVISKAAADKVSKSRGFRRTYTGTMPYDAITAKRDAAEMDAAVAAGGGQGREVVT